MDKPADTPPPVVSDVEINGQVVPITVTSRAIAPEPSEPGE